MTLGGAVEEVAKVCVAILMPPLAVIIEKSGLDKDVAINVLLCLLAYLPGKAADMHASMQSMLRCGIL